MTSPGSTHSTTPHPSTTVQSEAYAVPSGHNRCLGGRPDRRWQVFGLKGTNLSVHLVTVASQASRPSARDGARSLIPLRGSPGLSPGSLLPLPRPTPFQEEPDAPPNLARYPTPRANKSKNAVQFGGDCRHRRSHRWRLPPWPQCQRAWMTYRLWVCSQVMNTGAARMPTHQLRNVRVEL